MNLDGESKKENIQTNKQKAETDSHIENKLMVSRGEEGGQMNKKRCR